MIHNNSYSKDSQLVPCTCIHPYKRNMHAWSNQCFVTMSLMSVPVVPSGYVARPCCTWILPFASLLVSCLLPSWSRMLLYPTSFSKKLLSCWVMWVVIRNNLDFLKFGNLWLCRSLLYRFMHLLSHIFQFR